MDPIKKSFGDLYDQLEVVEADLTDADSLAEAIAGSTHVVHVASPFPAERPKDEMELIKPAVEGTMAVLKACRANRIKRLVVTSSCAAIQDVDPADAPDVFDESVWSNPDRPQGMTAYAKSKVLAEKAAWEYCEGLPAEEKIELVTILPGFVVGPSLCGPGFTSSKAILFIMSGKGLPRMSFPVVDVREVALAHLKAV